MFGRKDAMSHAVDTLVGENSRVNGDLAFADRVDLQHARLLEQLAGPRVTQPDQDRPATYRSRQHAGDPRHH